MTAPLLLISSFFLSSSCRVSQKFTKVYRNNKSRVENVHTKREELPPLPYFSTPVLVLCSVSDHVTIGWLATSLNKTLKAIFSPLRSSSLCKNCASIKEITECP